MVQRRELRGAEKRTKGCREVCGSLAWPLKQEWVNRQGSPVFHGESASRDGRLQCFPAAQAEGPCREDRGPCQEGGGPFDEGGGDP